MESGEVSPPKPLYSSCPAQLQLCDDVTMETYTSPDSLAFLNPVKKEGLEHEGFLCCGTSNNPVDLISNEQQTEDLQRKCVKDEESDEFLYCEEFRSFFTNSYDVHTQSLFFDNPVPMEMDDRARQTLPPDFGLGKSDIPDTGIGVFNNKETISLAAHFGPCDGDLVGKEEAMTSAYSWMLCGNSTMETYTTPDSLAFVNPVKKEDHEEGSYLCGGTSNPMGSIILEDQQTGGFQRKPVREAEPINDEFLYCEICRSYFTNMCEVHGSALFIYDTPVPMGIENRAKQTLPPGLELKRKSDISGAGQGVFNNGETIPLGAHFGPHEGELVDREAAMNSGFSWVIFKSGQCEEYIDAKREIYSNWMRYVNCARNKSEQNLVAIQYRGGIFYRCCQPIEPGQELLMWYEDDYGKDLGVAFDYLWKNKCSSNETNNALLPTFSCSWCPLSYTSRIYFDNHIRRSHSNRYAKQLPSEEVRNQNLMLAKSSASQQTRSGTTGTDLTHGQDNRGFYQCNCGMSFTDPDDWKTHQCIRTSGNPYPSSKDDVGSNQQDDPQQCRSSGLSSEKKYHCSQCGKSFNNGRNYRQHHRIHTGEKPYECAQCGKCFRQQTHLRTHQRIHTGEKPYHCSQCGKSFNNGSNYRQHQRIHTGEKPYHCSVCGKSFTSQSHLNDHERIHTGEKPYQCSHCRKVFNKSSSLNRHQHIHTGKKPYHCSTCGQSFTYSITCKRHKCSMAQPSGV